MYPPLPGYGNTGGFGMPSLPGSVSYSGPAMLPPLPGMMPGLPQMPQLPNSYPQAPSSSPYAPPVVPGAPPPVPFPSKSTTTPSPAVEPMAAGIQETPCQAVHVPPEENFFTVSVHRSNQGQVRSLVFFQ